MKVGFVGLGHMGGPMAGNILAAGHDLVVHDLHREAGTALVAAGAAWAASPRETAAGRDAVIAAALSDLAAGEVTPITAARKREPS